MINHRYSENAIQELCFSGHKMAFVSGPRQCGKTTLAKRLLKTRGNGSYNNWDNLAFRKTWTKNPNQIIQNLETKIVPLIVLDEIHKAKLWKRNLKGVFDTLDIPCDIMVTGSTRLSVYKKGGDSLLGRYYHFRLHPFSLAELCNTISESSPETLLERLKEPQFATPEHSNFLSNLDTFGPFPEPLLSGSVKKRNAWRLGRVERLVREDLRDLTRIPELSQIEMLVSLLPERASNILSIRSLAEDLEVAYTTIQRWLHYLEELYYHFEVKPYSKNIVRGLKKERKLYLWDWSEIENEGARFENLIASHLLKYVHFLCDAGYGKFELSYLRNKEKKEIDFLILKNNRPFLPIEIKLSDTIPSKNWQHLIPQTECKLGLQIIKTTGHHTRHHYPFGDILIISADQFLANLV
jgi:predicted AAA+ superfamily ATPase